MPGVKRYGINKAIEFLKGLEGLSSVLLFGVVGNLPKDDIGSNADSADNPMIQLLPKLRKDFPNLLIACDVSFLLH